MLLTKYFEYFNRKPIFWGCVCVCAGIVGHFVCKIADTQLVYDFFALTREPNPVHVIFFFFSQHTVPLYARVGNLQSFARIHKSWTVLVCNVVLGLNVDFGVSPLLTVVTHIHTHTHTHTHTQRDTHAHTRTHTFELKSLKAKQVLVCVCVCVCVCV